MDSTLLEALQKHVEGVVQKSVKPMRTTLHESEVKVQNTINTAHELMDARIRNQHKHHEEDMRTLHDQMLAFQRGPFEDTDGR